MVTASPGLNGTILETVKYAIIKNLERKFHNKNSSTWVLQIFRDPSLLLYGKYLVAELFAMVQCFDVELTSPLALNDHI